MGNDQDDVFVVSQEVFQPGRGVHVQTVGRFVQKKDVRVAKKGLGQKDLNLVAFRQLAHLLLVHVFRNAHGLEKLGSISFRVPAVQFRKFRFQFSRLDPVFFTEVGLGVKCVTLLHDLVELLVALNHSFHNGKIFKGKVILVQAGHSFVRAHAD